MSLERYFRRGLGLACLLLATAGAPAGAFDDSAFERRLQQQRSTESQLQEELQSTAQKRREAEAALERLNQDLRDKQRELSALQSRLEEPLSHAQKELVDNEQQRVALAELAIKSRLAAVERLERKEQELQQSLAATAKRIAGIQAEQRASARRAREEAEAKSRELAAQLEALQRENEALRLAMEEEARRAQAAREEAARLAELARAEEQTMLEGEGDGSAADPFWVAGDPLEPEENANQTNEPAPAYATTEIAPPPQSWMFQQAAEPATEEVLTFEEAPTSEELTERQVFDGNAILMRSRNIERPVRLVPAGEHLYKAAVEVQPGQAYFSLDNRRYRGYFPEGGDGTYVFMYDMSNVENPRLSVKKSDEPATVASDATDNF